MAKIGEADAANRYDGISVGPRLDYTFETQAGIPVDGSNELLRDLSPFTMRFVLPDALLALAAGEDEQLGIDLITAAIQGVDRNPLAGELSKYLANVTPINTETTQLETFVAEGQYLSASGSSVYPTIANAVQAADVALQVQRLLAVPPLTLLINPNNMQISYNQIQNYSTRTRYGFVFERWGEEQPSISFSGSTGAFMAGAASAPGTDVYAAQGRGSTTVPTGVQFASKRDSAAWQNLMSLMLFYRSNGYIYDTIGKTEAHLFIGSIAIDYDQWTYEGHIESFDYTYDEGMPHRVEWSMEFKVSRMYDNAASTYSVLPMSAPTTSPSDPKYSNSGTSTSSRALTATGVLGSGAAEQSATAASSAFRQDSRYGSIPFDLLE